MKMLQPQEVEVHYILPSIRRELAVAMKLAGKSQKDISELLGVTEAAVSQYISNKRAKHVVFPEELKNAINVSAPKISDTNTMIREVQGIVALAKKQRFICRLHEELEGGIPKGCDVCFK